MDMRKITHASNISIGQYAGRYGHRLSGNIHLIDTSDLTTFLGQQFERDMFIEVFDLLMPFISVEGGAHQLPLFFMKRCITTKHEIKTTFSHEPLEAIVPHHVEILGIFQDEFRSLIRHDVDSRWDRRRSIPRILILTAKATENLAVLATSCQSRRSWRFTNTIQPYLGIVIG